MAETEWLGQVVAQAIAHLEGFRFAKEALVIKQRPRRKAIDSQCLACRFAIRSGVMVELCAAQ